MTLVHENKDTNCPTFFVRASGAVDTESGGAVLDRSMYLLEAYARL